MSMIKDGTGEGTFAKVCANNLLHVHAVRERMRLWKAMQGRSYVMASGLLSVTATKGLMGWFQYTNTSRLLALCGIDCFWNGGSANHNRTCEVEFTMGDTEPDTNTATLVARNTNTMSSSLLSMTNLVWDEVSTGMTGHTPGISLNQAPIAQGMSTWDMGGALIVGPDATLSIYARGEEAGVFSFTTWAYEIAADDSCG